MHDRRRIALLGAPLLLGALALAPALAAHAGSPHYARTVTSPRPIDPKAIPPGDGYVSTTPKVGYVDSCQTQFGGIGGAGRRPVDRYEGEDLELAREDRRLRLGHV